MVRCQRCGLRLPDSAPTCATHGPLPIANPPSPAEQMPATPPHFELPGFRIDRILGQGGFGVVYLATKESSGQPVAIKVATPEQFRATERLMRECAALETTGAPFAPIVYQRGTIGDQFYIAMEYFPLETLADVLVQ